MSQAYTATVLDHFNNPRNVGENTDADGIARVENPVTGATLELYLDISRDQIRKAVFKSLGCTATIAAGSILTELVDGLRVEDAGAITKSDIETALGGLPPTRKHAASLAEDAIRAAVANYQAKVVS
jgi:nitrogen fixation NifU-like protein